jgi:hypothetical protein
MSMHSRRASCSNNSNRDQHNNSRPPSATEGGRLLGLRSRLHCMRIVSALLFVLPCVALVSHCLFALHLVRMFQHLRTCPRKSGKRIASSRPCARARKAASLSVPTRGVAYHAALTPGNHCSCPCLLGSSFHVVLLVCGSVFRAGRRAWAQVGWSAADSGLSAAAEPSRQHESSSGSSEQQGRKGGTRWTVGDRTIAHPSTPLFPAWLPSHPSAPFLCGVSQAAHTPHKPPTPERHWTLRHTS